MMEFMNRTHRSSVAIATANNSGWPKKDCIDLFRFSNV